MQDCKVSMRVEGSRMPDLARAIEMQVAAGDQDILRQIAESAADPRDFIHDPDRHRAVLEHLNAYLKYDGLELQPAGLTVRLVQAGPPSL
jgi:hypothetical protein